MILVVIKWFINSFNYCWSTKLVFFASPLSKLRIRSAKLELDELESFWLIEVGFPFHATRLVLPGRIPLFRWRFYKVIPSYFTFQLNIKNQLIFKCPSWKFQAIWLKCQGFIENFLFCFAHLELILINFQ